MKFSDVAMLMLVISAVFVMGVLMLNDMQQAYPNTTINTSELDKYNSAEDIENAVEPLKEKWADIESEDKGWKKFVTGLAAVPNVILSFVSVVFSSFAIATTFITNGVVDLGVPPALIGIILAMVTVFMLFKLVAWWQRSET